MKSTQITSEPSIVIPFSRRALLKGSSLLALSGALGGCATMAPGSSASPQLHSNMDPMSLVHPELRSQMEALVKALADILPLTRDSLPMLRAPEPDIPGAAGVPVVARHIPGRHGSPDVQVYVVNAKPGQRRPGIVSLHGGGFVAGTARTDAQMATTMAKALDCCVVSVEYRLAPETTWEGSVEDNYAALKWLHDHADELGVDRKRIAVMGNSAGGGHAALLAVRARDRGEVPLVLQCLTMPMLDDRTGSSRAVVAHIGGLIWTAASNRFGWQSFLGRAPGGQDVPVAAVPARTTNLAGLAPTFIGVGSIDLFVEEDIEYARRLMVAGVPTELVIVPGAPHGFEMADTASVTRQFQLARLNALQRAFDMPASVGSVG